MDRRRYLKWMFASAPALTLILRNRGLGSSQQPPPRWREFRFSRLATLITPTEQFFLRSHLDYPQLDPAKWKLKVEGLVARPLEINYTQLTALRSTSRIVTFECSGNPPGGGLVSTAEWRGISLSQLLDKAGVLTTAKEVVFEGGDFGLDEAESVPLSYARSIPVEKALAAETMIAWEMNGERLRWEHGFPARLIVPGYYAMSHVKWLSRIRLIDRPFKGFYMVKRYFTARRLPGGEFETYPALKMKVKSQIARPASGEHLAKETCLIAGAAWTGDGLISRVELSLDNGITWQAASLLDRPTPHAWMRWEFPWLSPSAGPQTVVCRAFDDQGEQQPQAPDTTLVNRYGNNWYHQVVFTIR